MGSRWSSTFEPRCTNVYCRCQLFAIRTNWSTNVTSSRTFYTNADTHTHCRFSVCYLLLLNHPYSMQRFLIYLYTFFDMFCLDEWEQLWTMMVECVCVRASQSIDFIFITNKIEFVLLGRATMFHVFFYHFRWFYLNVVYLIANAIWCCCFHFFFESMRLGGGGRVRCFDRSPWNRWTFSFASMTIHRLSVYLLCVYDFDLYAFYINQRYNGIYSIWYYMWTALLQCKWFSRELRRWMG